VPPELSGVELPWGQIYHFPGIRGYPGPLHQLLTKAVPQGDRLLDLNPGVGIASSYFLAQGLRVVAQETSAGALAALRLLQSHFPGLEVQARLPYEVQDTEFDTVLLALPAERGSEWVRSLIESAAHALTAGGELWLAGSKERGFGQYFKFARNLLGSGEVVRHQGPLRLAKLIREAAAPAVEWPWLEFTSEVRGAHYRFHTLPGVFSSSELDQGSRYLLEAIPELEPGLKVLDLGAGYGALSLPLVTAGVDLTLLEDDLVSVMAARRNLPQQNVVHSFFDSGLTSHEQFDIVMVNPPFHVGGEVFLSRIFVEVARQRLRQNGQIYLVANEFLPYETWARELFKTVAVWPRGRYKIVVAQ
jgi:16S rRNA (guanine1207-N2)-methyltransferase